MADPLPTVTLRGTHVRLEPLTAAHTAAIAAAADGPRDTFTYTWVPQPTEEAARRYIDTALAAHTAGTALPFATVRLHEPGNPDGPGTVVGSTRFMNIEWWTFPADRPAPAHLAQRRGPEAVEIGSTWLNAAAQRTAVNTEAKLLMLTYAFEVLGTLRVAIRTDVRNTRSRANIERVGARLEGILRNQMYAHDGTGARDTASYAIIAEEWPEVQRALRARLRDS